MRNFGCYFSQQKTLLWRSREDSPTARVFRYGIKVEIGIETQQRKLKSVLPALFSMTSSRIATVGSQNGLNIQFKTDWVCRLRTETKKNSYQNDGNCLSTQLANVPSSNSEKDQISQHFGNRVEAGRNAYFIQNSREFETWKEQKSARFAEFRCWSKKKPAMN